MKTAFILVIFFVISGCSQKVSPSVERGLPLTAAAVKGQELFMKNCNKCHPDGMAGRGPALINKPLPGFFIKFQVRNGLGAMPSFKKQQLSKSDLNNLTKYIKERKVRNQKQT